jgi:branched-chain amino acid transport system ATP-binding protein
VHALEVKGLHKNFGGLQAIQDISFSLEVGEHLGVIGPNGAGKTTLFNLINGQLRPDAGRIHIFDQDITARPIHYRTKIGLGRTFQVTNLLSNLTVINNVLLAIQAFKPSRFGMYQPLSAYGGLSDEAQKLMAPWGLWECRDMPVRDLSYGQQRCLELVLGLASKPKLLLLDEPTCGMTPAEVTGITSMIQTLGRGIALVVIAHDMDLIFGLDLDRITVLHYGQIVAEGTQQEIKLDPRVREIYLGEEGEEESVTTN